MPEFGLIGYPLSHSFSKNFFSKKFEKLSLDNCTYKNFEIDVIEKLKDIINQHPDLAGFNVTIPYKEKIINYLDELDETAKNVGAVNTVKIFSAGGINKLKGFNTDVYGFEQSLKPFLKEHHQTALVLGTGGASKAITYVLKKLNISFRMVSRTRVEDNFVYDDLAKETIQQHFIIINTTPLGTYPETDIAPQIPYQHLNSNHLCYDLIYNPEETLFLKKAKLQGATTKNGMEMLQLQAEKAWQIWTDNKFKL